MYQILFIHLPLGGHLGCFQFLALMSNSVVNIHTYVHFFCVNPQSGIAGLWFKRLQDCFSKVVKPFYIPTSMCEGSIFPTSFRSLLSYGWCVPQKMSTLPSLLSHPRLPSHCVNTHTHYTGSEIVCSFNPLMGVLRFKGNSCLLTYGLEFFTHIWLKLVQPVISLSVFSCS